MADEPLIDKIHDLSDLELATLICLVAQEHCIIDTEPDSIDDLVLELELVAAKVFGLSHAVIDCSEHTSLDDFAYSILSAEGSPARSTSPVRTRADSYFLNAPTFQSIAARSPVSENFADNKSIANVIIAKNLDEAPKQVQIQALELMRTKRIYTRTSVQSAPKRFLFIALLAGGEGPRLTKHLNDQMFISHFHDPEDGFPNLEEKYDDGSSISSVVKKSPIVPEPYLLPRISAMDIEHLSQLSEYTTVTVELSEYQQDIIAFLRLHRAVAGGISATATRNFDKLSKCLAPLHDLSYATPSLVALAARKIYPHRIHIVQPEKERSMQWGSDVDAVAAELDGIGAEDVIEDVLGSAGAETPL
ncbi:hypothetical protein LHYA1_G001828 [Lachnellula hyalina]|uniref:Magnesium chelatase n=1 Tax=Lachnellula hyalina TaxID=1316788 RepID=A0A8H8R6I4_9HELO|nr:uncharacterized protein LHYA1_G001828 [Lachnellula hyalina]TVY29374.1 hypothetical protein LHYA1_G001828 [Lachnellula hyalina]